MEKKPGKYEQTKKEIDKYLLPDLRKIVMSYSDWGIWDMTYDYYLTRWILHDTIRSWIDIAGRSWWHVYTDCKFCSSRMSAIEFVLSMENEKAFVCRECWNYPTRTVEQKKENLSKRGVIIELWDDERNRLSRI